MKTTNKILMAQARESLGGNWSLAVGCVLVSFLIGCAASFIPLGGILIGGPLSIGSAYFFLTLSRNRVPVINDLLRGFDKNFLNPLLAMLLVVIFTLLWALLFIIPGIIAAISYSQVFYILTEDSSITAWEAIEKSKKMMYGYKWKYFCLGLRFIGWVIVCIFTAGIGFFWLAPYMQVTFAKFHDDIKSGNEAVK